MSRNDRTYCRLYGLQSCVLTFFYLLIFYLLFLLNFQTQINMIIHSTIHVSAKNIYLSLNTTLRVEIMCFYIPVIPAPTRRCTNNILLYIGWRTLKYLCDV